MLAFTGTGLYDYAPGIFGRGLADSNLCFAIILLGLSVDKGFLSFLLIFFFIFLLLDCKFPNLALTPIGFHIDNKGLFFSHIFVLFLL